MTARWPIRSRPAAALLVAGLVSGCLGPSESPPPGPRPTSVVVSPARLVIAEGQTRALTVAILDDDGASLDAPVRWFSSNDGVATVSAEGVVTAHEIGLVTVGAQAGGAVATAVVTVVAGLEVVLRAAPDPEGRAVEAGDCPYTLEATAVGGAPGDRAAWAEGEIEFVDAAGVRSTVALSPTDLVDRFGAASIQAGETLTARPVAHAPEPGFRIVHRLRYEVYDETRSVSASLDCPAAATRLTPPR